MSKGTVWFLSVNVISVIRFPNYQNWDFKYALVAILLAYPWLKEKIVDIHVENPVTAAGFNLICPMEHLNSLTLSKLTPNLGN
jgi:hypothetical protein